MNRFSPSRNYLAAGIAAAACSAVSAWFALRWAPSWIPTFLFGLTAAALVFLYSRPSIEIRSRGLAIGSRIIPWPAIQRIDRTGWVSPLVLVLTLEDEERLWLIYPGDIESAYSLLHLLIHNATDAETDAEELRTSPDEQISRAAKFPKYPLLRSEDEAEVERLYQRLKTVGHLDSKNSSDES